MIIPGICKCIIFIILLSNEKKKKKKKPNESQWFTAKTFVYKILEYTSRWGYYHHYYLTFFRIQMNAKGFNWEKKWKPNHFHSFSFCNWVENVIECHIASGMNHIFFFSSMTFHIGCRRGALYFLFKIFYFFSLSALWWWEKWTEKLNLVLQLKGHQQKSVFTVDCAQFNSGTWKRKLFKSWLKHFVSKTC